MILFLIKGLVILKGIDTKTLCQSRFNVFQKYGKYCIVLGPLATGKHVILPTTLNFVVRRCKLRSYTLQNPPKEV